MPNPQTYKGGAPPSRQQPEKGAKADFIIYKNGKGRLEIEADTSNKTAMNMIKADFILKWIWRFAITFLCAGINFKVIMPIINKALEKESLHPAEANISAAHPLQGQAFGGFIFLLKRKTCARKK